MVSLKRFYQAYTQSQPLPNPDQRKAIEAGAGDGVFIVAGPGTGKTACLTLRILKLILVDGISPRGILATTFTRKAAAELRSRILSRGFSLIQALQDDPQTPEKTRGRLARLDINQVITGTIDSICEQLLRDYREPGMMPPVTADEYVSRTLLLRDGLLSEGRYRNDDLDAFLLDLRGGSAYGWNLGTKTSLVQVIWSTRFQDQLDWPRFVRSGPVADRPARRLLDEALTAYAQALEERSMVDYTMLEQAVLDRLRQGQLTEFTDQISVVLVDEYQDTNLLQEAIYFEFARACDGGLTVVGDDDQSLYRFRGATVELFSQFSERYHRAFEREVAPVFLRTNYRSTRGIVDFVNDYATLDTSYQAVRVADKPPLIAHSGEVGVPVLGMFRDSLEDLTADLANFVHAVFRGAGYRLPDGTRLQRSRDGGDLGDCALLCSSPAERSSGGNPRLPLTLREELADRTPSVAVFNPRGQDVADIDVVEVFGGLLLECLDPGGVVEGSINLSQNEAAVLTRWRQSALAYADQPARQALMDYASGWASRESGGAGYVWPRSVPTLDLVYGLMHFFPELYDDPEGQVYLEVFTRQLAACEQIGGFKARLVEDPDDLGLSQASVRELLRNFLSPIASGAVGINEDLIEAFPRDRLSILSVHQAKGLEFPLVIVDVGSDFKTNHHAHAFKRFPADAGGPHRIEDLLRPFSELAGQTGARPGRDRAFDDLFRQFFVAYSRPQEALLLVGLRTTFPGGRVANVATGWNRAGTCLWDGAIPFVEI